MHLVTGMTDIIKHQTNLILVGFKTSILTFGGVIVLAWETIFAILTSHGHPTRHLGDQTWILFDF